MDEVFAVRDKRKPRHHWADNEVLDIYGPKIGVFGYAVYMAMARWADNDTGRCYKSQGEIAAVLGISPDTVQRAIAGLLEHRLVGKRQEKKGKPCIYFLLEVTKVEPTHLPPAAAPRRADDLPPTAACGNTDLPPAAVTPTAHSGNHMPLIAGDLPPAAVDLPLSAAANKESKLFSRLNSKLESKPSRSESERAGDSRHSQLRDSIKRLQVATIGYEVWDGRAGKKLAEILERSTATVEQLQTALVWWAMSPDESRGKHPAEWLGKLTGFQQGPLDRYGKPVSLYTEALVGTTVIQDRYAQLLAIAQGLEKKPSRSKALAGVAR